MTRTTLQASILCNQERVMEELDLAGIANAPGIRTDITQRCRMILTDRNRIVFSQVRQKEEDLTDTPV